MAFLNVHISDAKCIYKEYTCASIAVCYRVTEYIQYAEYIQYTVMGKLFKAQLLYANLETLDC